MLNFLPDSFKDVKITIKSSIKTLILDNVLGALRSRDLEIKF